MSKRKYANRRQRRNDKRALKEWQECGRTNRHHDKAVSRHGSSEQSNIYRWDIIAHRAFHFLFGNRTLLEAAAWLKHIHEQKQRGISLDIRGE